MLKITMADIGKPAGFVHECVVPKIMRVQFIVFICLMHYWGTACTSNAISMCNTECFKDLTSMLFTHIFNQTPVS